MKGKERAAGGRRLTRISEEHAALPAPRGTKLNSQALPPKRQLVWPASMYRPNLNAAHGARSLHGREKRRKNFLAACKQFDLFHY